MDYKCSFNKLYLRAWFNFGYKNPKSFLISPNNVELKRI